MFVLKSKYKLAVEQRDNARSEAMRLQSIVVKQQTVIDAQDREIAAADKVRVTERGFQASLKGVDNARR